jgi:hypothetical protein
MLESLVAMQGRIAQIQQRLGVQQTPAASPPPAPFSTYLAGALRGAAGVGAAHGHATPPPELERYGNGRIPAAALAAVGGTGHRLWQPAAAAFERMAADAAASGARITITDSYRTFDAQLDVARRKGLYREGGLAAEPGTSTHGWGLSVDVDPTPQTLGWLRRNAGRYGFVEDVPREPWHWTFRSPA